MSRRGILAGGWLVLVAPLVASASGCAKLTCEDKATCPDPAGDIDGSASGSGSGSSSGSASGSGSGSSSGSASGSGSGASSGSGSGGTPTCGAPEDCTNGVDDDCNGLTDCADPACAAFQCTAAAPDGWSGPGILFQGGDGGAPPDCPSAFGVVALDGKSNPSTAAASCGCTCNAPTGAACSTSVTFYYDSVCNNVCQSNPGSATCTSSCSGAQMMTLNETLTAAGTCTPHPTTTVPPATWGGAGRVCSASKIDANGGCASGMVCAAKPPAPFNAASCVWQTGDVACPLTTETRSVYYAGATDSRGCSACTCGTPKGGTCTGAAFTTYSDTACTMGPTLVSATGCVAAPSGSHGVEETAASTPTQGSCTATGGTPSGSLTPSGATTICCAAP